MAAQPDRRDTSGSKVKVKSYRRRDGRVVKAYERGTTQTRGDVQRRGLNWGGRQWETAGGLSAWLRARGSSLATFTKKHPSAARGFRDLSTAMKGEQAMRRKQRLSSRTRAKAKPRRRR